MSWWRRLSDGLKRTSSSLGTAVADLVTKRKLDRAMLEDIEDVLLRADLGTAVASRIANAVGVGRYDKSISADEVKAVVASEVEKVLAPARSAAWTRGSLLGSEPSAKDWKRPQGFAHDQMESCLGVGDAVFSAARNAFAAWAPFDLGWARVANPQAAIQVGEIVAVEVRSLGLWSVNISRIVDVWNSAGKYGFTYSTTPMHVEQGEERFLLRFDPSTGEVWYELEALSRPRNLLARIGYPVTRAFQHRFARDSHRRMQAPVDRCDIPS